MQHTGWGGFAAFAGVVVVASAFVAPEVLGNLVWPGLIAATAAAVAAGVHLHRPRHHQPWTAITGGMVLLLVAALVGAPALESLELGEGARELLHAGALTLFAIGGLQFAAGHRAGRRRERVVDLAIVVLAVVTALWALSVQALAAEQVGALRQLVYVALPVVPAMLVAGLVHVLLLRGGRVPSAWLLATAVVTWLGRDFVGQAVELTGVAIPADHPGPWLAALGLLGTAALHPSMRQLTEPVRTADGTAGRVRMVGFGLALVAAPVALLWSSPGELGTALLPLAGVIALGATVLVRVAWMIRAQESAVEELRVSMARDELTGLASRRALLEHLARAAARAQRRSVAVVFLDLDGFKEINDFHGHDVGDAVLVRVGARLREAVPDYFVSRFAGDEFVVVVEPSTTRRVEAVSLAVRQALAEPVQVGDRSFTLQTSVGACELTAGDTPGDVLLRADAAMYHAKAAGPGRFAWFNQRLRDDVARRAELDRWLREAVGGDQFHLVYQPILQLGPDGSKGPLVAVEALLRWQHPTVGDIAPNEFIPVSERSGLIGPLGKWVIERACRQLADWRAHRPEAAELCLFVNLSPAQLDTIGLVDYVRRVLERTGVPPDRLGFELTETAVLRESEEVHRTLHQLAELGVRLALDDFGTGFSSLERLRTLPVHLIKVDRSFVSGLDQLSAPREQEIVAAVAGLGRGLGLPVLAEGVESKAQLRMAARAGCRYAQGYALAHPMPPAAIDTLLGRAPAAGPSWPVPSAPPRLRSVPTAS